MFIFKILRLIVDLLPWALLALMVYTLWPYLQAVMRAAQIVHNFLK